MTGVQKLSGNKLACGPHWEPDCPICYPALVEFKGPVPPAPAPKPATLLGERGKTHGVYAEQATLTQRHRAILRNTIGWGRLTDVQRDALEMISVKISRIITGDHNHRDHWEDIAGYATLAANGGHEP